MASLNVGHTQYWEMQQNIKKVSSVFTQTLCCPLHFTSYFSSSLLRNFAIRNNQYSNINVNACFLRICFDWVKDTLKELIGKEMGWIAWGFLMARLWTLCHSPLSGQKAPQRNHTKVFCIRSGVTPLVPLATAQPHLACGDQSLMQAPLVAVGPERERVLNF